MLYYHETYSPLIVALPEAVNDFDLDQISHILIELLPASRLIHYSHSKFSSLDTAEAYIHHKIEVKQKVKIPAFLNQRMSQNILDLHGIDILIICESANLGELERRGKAFHLLLSGLFITHIMRECDRGV